MPTIVLTTYISAPIERCFDLARSVDAHQLSMAHTKEKAIAGRTSGLCELGDTITWEAWHLGVKQKLTVRITQMDKPNFFEDEMIKGAFAMMRHQHIFTTDGTQTVMKDVFEFAAPLGPLGRLAEWLFLEKYMLRFLKERNRVLKELAEKMQAGHTAERVLAD